MTTQLYRHFDDEGHLLYVGISLCAIARLTQHRRESGWFRQIRRIEVTPYPTRREALDAELKAIREECPLHNVDGTDRKRPRRPPLPRTLDALHKKLAKDPMAFSVVDVIDTLFRLGERDLGVDLLRRRHAALQDYPGRSFGVVPCREAPGGRLHYALSNLPPADISPGPRPM